MAPPAAPTGPSNRGPDGETIVDMSYYEILGLRGDADAVAIKKAYRKAAIRWHPDKNVGDPTAAAKFQDISEAYAVLSDSNLRAVYNKQGKKSAVEAGGEGAMPDPGELFSQLFGGKAFEDWIGEISLGKDVSKAFEMSASEEEKEKIAKAEKDEAKGATTASSTPAVPLQGTIHHASFEEPSSEHAVPPPTYAYRDAYPSKAVPTTSTSSFSATSPPPSVAGSSAGAVAHEAAAAEKKAKASKLFEEQKENEKMYEMQKERAEEKRKRVSTLAQKLRDRVRPFVEASKPGDAEDPETKRYADRIREETADLAMESFGVEICNLIGEVYMQKASQFIRLHRRASSNILGVPGWWSRVKEKGTMLKEGWSFLSVGLDVKSAMEDMERRQAKGELDEEEMKNIEADLSGKLLLVAWKGSKFELSTVLRSVVDAVLAKDEPSVTDATLMNRAKAILLTGAILKSVTADETDTERREVERMVAEAARKRKEKSGKGKKATPPVTPAV